MNVLSTLSPVKKAMFLCNRKECQFVMKSSNTTSFSCSTITKQTNKIQPIVIYSSFINAAIVFATFDLLRVLVVLLGNLYKPFKKKHTFSIFSMTQMSLNVAMQVHQHIHTFSSRANGEHQQYPRKLIMFNVYYMKYQPSHSNV